MVADYNPRKAAEDSEPRSWPMPAMACSRWPRSPCRASYSGAPYGCSVGIAGYRFPPRPGHATFHRETRSGGFHMGNVGSDNHAGRARHTHTSSFWRRRSCSAGQASTSSGLSSRPYCRRIRAVCICAVALPQGSPMTTHPRNDGLNQQERVTSRKR